MAHLKPGGHFVFDFEHIPTNNGDTDDNTWERDWYKESEDIIIAWRNRNRYNSTTKVWNRLFVVEKYVQGCLVESEANERSGRFFTVEEGLECARSAGFIFMLPPYSPMLRDRPVALAAHRRRSTRLNPLRQYLRWCG